MFWLSASMTGSEAAWPKAVVILVAFFNDVCDANKRYWFSVKTLCWQGAKVVHHGDFFVAAKGGSTPQLSLSDSYCFWCSSRQAFFSWPLAL